MWLCINPMYRPKKATSNNAVRNVKYNWMIVFVSKCTYTVQNAKYPYMGFFSLNTLIWCSKTGIKKKSFFLALFLLYLPLFKPNLYIGRIQKKQHIFELILCIDLKSLKVLIRCFTITILLCSQKKICLDIII